MRKTRRVIIPPELAMPVPLIFLVPLFVIMLEFNRNGSPDNRELNVFERFLRWRKASIETVRQPVCVSESDDTLATRLLIATLVEE
jgi:hypothetical protein